MNYEIDFPISFLKQYQISQETVTKLQTFDILYVISGKLEITTGQDASEQYESGQLTALHSHNTYVLTPFCDSVLLHMGLKTDFIDQFIGSDYRIILDSAKEPNRDYLMVKRLLFSIAAGYQDTAMDHTLSIYGQLFQLIDLLLKEFTLNLPGHGTDASPKYRDRINQIQEYIGQNYAQPITLNSMADAMHLTPQYLSKFFKTCFSVNFNEYLNSIRIEHALRDLKYTKQSITEIAINHGFPNISTFNRHFRDTCQMSPRDYRKALQHREPVRNEWPDENLELKTVVAASSIYDRNITVDVSNVIPYSNHCCDLINIGFAGNLLSDDYQKQFVEAHRILQFRYVRMEGLVSNALIPRFVTVHQYQFAHILSVLDFLRAQNVIPFLELGKNSFDYAQAYAPDIVYQNYSSSHRFQEMLCAFLELVKERYEREWCEQWVFELWKTPGESNAEYLKAFHEIQKILRAYFPEAKLGGPGYNTCAHSDNFLESV